MIISDMIALQVTGKSRADQGAGSRAGHGARVRIAASMASQVPGIAIKQERSWRIMHANLDPFSFSAGPCTDLAGNDHVGYACPCRKPHSRPADGMFENAARLVIETSEEVEVSFFLYQSLQACCRHAAIILAGEGTRQ